MKTVLAVLSFLCLFNQVYSQVTEEWVKRKNGPGNLADASTFTAVDNSGNVYVTGYSRSTNNGDDYSTIKYNSSGVQQWEARYDGPGHSTDAAYQVKVDGFGNVYVTGLSRSGATSNTEDFATVKYNSAGVQQWVSRYNGPGNSSDAAYNMVVENSGNVYITGLSQGAGTDNDYTTIKYNSAGDSLWVRRYNGPGNSMDNSYRIAVSDSGNVYVTGYSRSGSGAGSEDCTVIKYNSAGVQQWVQRYNNGANEMGLSIAVDGAGNVYVGGFAWNGFSYIDYLTIKYNAAGIQQWINVNVASGTEIIYSMAVDASGNVYVTGFGYGIELNEDYVTIKYNSAGTPQWSKNYNGPGNSSDTAYSLALDDSGNVYVTGSSWGSGTGSDYATVKYNSSGVQKWVQRYNGPGSGTDIANSLRVDGSGNVLVTGRSIGSGTDYDYTTIKYSQTGSLMTLNLTAFIQGFYNSGSNSMINDTVKVFLKNNSFPFNTIDSAKAKLSSSGTGTFLFSNAVNGVNYYLAVKHRNSIETWSSSPVAFTSGNSTYNFATVVTQAYGDNQIRVDLSPLRFAVYSGDVNQNGTVDGQDLALTDNDAFNFVSGYVKTDVTGNGTVDAVDLGIIDNNAFNFVSLVRP